MSRTALCLAALLTVLLSSTGCSQPKQAAPTTWTTGFWFWRGSSVEGTEPANPVDVIFCQVATIEDQRLDVYASLPEQLPPAREYWVVFRYEGRGIPGLEAVPKLVEAVERVLDSAERRKLVIAGIQLDVDSPTASLPRYARFLRELKSKLPSGIQLSITALLDWFRSGTEAAAVIQEVDEFVPQFYDTQPRDGSAIAARFEAARWAPILNRYEKRYRIGISTFGRATATGARGFLQTYTELKPLDFGVNPEFHLDVSKTEAQELVLRYAGAGESRVGYARFDSGDVINFTLPTPESIRAAVEQAKFMRGYCAGVVFFRWPGKGELLAAQPREALSAAGVLPIQPPSPATLRAVDGECVAVACVDLFLLNSRTFSPKPVHYRIAVSAALEYFLPRENVPVRMAGPSSIEVSLPPYGGFGRLFLGRAVTGQRASYSLKETP